MGDEGSADTTPEESNDESGPDQESVDSEFDQQSPDHTSNGEEKAEEASEDSKAEESSTEESSEGLIGRVTSRAGRLREWLTWRRVLGGTGLTVVFVAIILFVLVPTSILGLVVNDTATFEADPAAPQNNTVAETGYALVKADEFKVTRQISPAGQKRTLVVVNKRRTYEKQISVQNDSYSKGVFVTVSSPVINIAGSSQNPLADMSHRELVEQFESALANGSNDLQFKKTGTEAASMLGQSTTVARFETNLTRGGEKRKVAVFVARARSEGDIVVAIGVHPTAFPGQRVNIFRLIYAVRHPS